MLAVWRLHGIDEILLAALNRGVILYGSSAGGICWFDSGVTGSAGFDGSLRPLTNGLGFLPGSHCPHFDLMERRVAHVEMVSSLLLGEGIGVDEFALVHYVGGSLLEVRSSTGDATAHLVERQADGAPTITALEARRL